MLPPFSGAAISQSAVVNNQVQLGDVFSTQTLNVDTVTDGVSVTTTGMGNGATAAVDTGSLNVQSTQAMSGVTGAQGSLNVGTYAGPTTMVATATANTIEADSLGGGALTGTISQSSTGATVTSENDYTGTAAMAGDPAVQIASISANSQAIANSATINAEGGSAVLTVNQTSASTVDGESGSAPPTGGATVQYSPGQVLFTSIAINNNVTATGTSGASQTLNVTQTSTGANTTAGQFLDAGNVQTAVGEAVATSNNISANNQAGDLNVTDSQTNGTYTQADSVVTAYEYGSAQSTAQGVGNAMMAANVGPTTEVSNTQNNTAGVQVMSSFTGGNSNGASYDSVSSASAIGNSATGFACTDCGGVLTVNNSQTNSGGVGASSTVTLTGSNRSVSSVATAVGNNATFYVSKSGN